MRTHRFLAPIFAALLLLGACSGSEGSDESAVSTEPPVSDNSNDNSDAAQTGDTATDPDSEADESDQDTTDHESAVDTCKLFTQADAEAAVGGVTMKLAESTLPDSCAYQSADEGPDYRRASVNYALDYGLSGSVEERANQQFENFDTGTPNSVAPHAVDSIDGAFAFQYEQMTSGQAAHVIFPSGDATISVAVNNGSLEGAIALATVVAGNL